jgi:HSP20 family protein
MGKRQQKDPIDFFYGDDCKWIFHEMQSIIEDIHFIDILQKKLRYDFAINKHSTDRSNTNIFPLLSPKIQENSPHPFKAGNKELKHLVEDGRLIDIMEGTQDVAVTVDIPGVEKEDIDLYVTADTLEITIDSDVLKFHKLLSFPCEVDVETAEATYRNGVLDVIIKKKGITR